jgi:hypothetical protein
VGDFVGRRRDLRLCLKALRHSPGVVLTGLGGVGKSTLAAQLVSEASEECFVVASLSGSAPPDAILQEIGHRLVLACLRERLDEAHPLRYFAQVVRDGTIDSSTRLEFLQDQLLAHKVLLPLLDNFEDNLAEEDGARHVIADATLGAFLAAWVRSPGAARLLVTSRHPFALPGGAEDPFLTHPVGPLSWLKTRKLLWRLRGLEALLPSEQRRAYERVGGHPRTLEYLDALLRGGRARFPDISRPLDAGGLPAPVPGEGARRGWRSSTGQVPSASPPHRPEWDPPDERLGLRGSRSTYGATANLRHYVNGHRVSGWP